MGFKKGDKNINRNGAPTKSDVLKLTDRLDKIMPIDTVLKKIGEQVEDGNMKAIELWMHYYFGKPKETLKLDGDLKVTGLKLIKASESRGDSQD